MTRPAVKALVSVDGSPARLTLHREKGVTVEPVFAWFEDKVGRAMVQKLTKPVRAVSGPPLMGNAVEVLADSLLEKGDRLGATLGKRAEGKTPLTSGSAQSRATKAWDATPAELLAALDAPENEGERFEALRIELMESLQRQKPVPSEFLALLLRRLPRESERARCTIYSTLTKHEDPTAYAALAAAFETDSASASFLASIVWRQRGTIDVLVQRLVRAWPVKSGISNASP